MSSFTYSLLYPWLHLWLHVWLDQTNQIYTSCTTNYFLHLNKKTSVCRLTKISLSIHAAMIFVRIFHRKKGRLTSVLSFHCCVWLPLCWKAFSENATPHQQHWANSMQKSPRQPLVHDWLATPEKLMVLNLHRSKYVKREIRAGVNKIRTLKWIGQTSFKGCQPIMYKWLSRWLLAGWPSAADVEWYSPKRPSSTVAIQHSNGSSVQDIFCRRTAWAIGSTPFCVMVTQAISVFSFSLFRGPDEGGEGWSTATGITSGAAG